jgi:Tfp pilus assembly protein PilF
MRRSWFALTGALGLAFASTGCYLPLMPGGASKTEATNTPSTIKGDKVEASPSETAKLCFATAKQLEDTGNYEEAIARYEKASDSDPRYAEPATRRLAILYDRIGNFDRARLEHEKILSKYPKDADTLNNLGYAYFLREQWDLAEQQLRQAVAASPEHKAAWINLGMTLAHKQQYDEALKTFLKAVTPAQAQCNLAFVYTTQGKREDAKAAYREALRIDPGLQFARQALGKLDNAGATQTVSTIRKEIAPPARIPPTPTPGGVVIDRDSPFIVDPADALPAPAGRK